MLRQLVKQHAQGTVILARRDDVNSKIEPLGSAFLCASGYLFTCAHLFSLNTPLCIVIPQELVGFQPISFEKVQIAKVQIRQYDAINDVALLKLDADAASNVPSNLLGDDSIVELGASCAFFGFPFSDSGLHVRHVAASVISAKVITPNGTKQYQLDAMVHEGCSGGPLFDRESQKAIGVVSGRFSPIGNSAGFFIGNRAIGTDSSISFATCISHGLALIEAEKKNA